MDDLAPVIILSLLRLFYLYLDKKAKKKVKKNSEISNLINIFFWERSVSDEIAMNILQEKKIIFITYLFPIYIALFSKQFRTDYDK